MKKGTLSIVIGWILIALQVISLMGSSIDSGLGQLSLIGLIGYLLPGIIGCILLVKCYKARNVGEASEKIEQPESRQDTPGQLEDINPIREGKDHANAGEYELATQSVTVSVEKQPEVGNFEKADSITLRNLRTAVEDLDEIQHYLRRIEKFYDDLRTGPGSSFSREKIIGHFSRIGAELCIMQYSMRETISSISKQNHPTNEPPVDLCRPPKKPEDNIRQFLSYCSEASEYMEAMGKIFNSYGECYENLVLIGLAEQSVRLSMELRQAAEDLRQKISHLEDNPGLPEKLRNTSTFSMTAEEIARLHNTSPENVSIYSTPSGGVYSIISRSGNSASIVEYDENHNMIMSTWGYFQ